MNSEGLSRSGVFVHVLVYMILALCTWYEVHHIEISDRRGRRGRGACHRQSVRADGRTPAP